MSFFAITSGFALAGAYCETNFAPLLLGPGLTGVGAVGGLPRLFGLTPGILIGTSFWTLTHGFKVGQARQKAIEDAKKDGEKDVEERYALPNLYAQGTSRHVRIFNCVQRSHQHIFETLPLAVISSLAGAVNYPITAAVLIFGFAVGRVILSTDYAKSEGEPAKRYINPLAPFMWYSLLSGSVLGILSCAKMVIGFTFI